MFNVKCFHCGKSFALNDDLVLAWLKEHEAEHPRYYPAPCHFCRRVIKVPVSQIRRYVPVGEAQEGGEGEEGGEGREGGEGG